MTENNKILKIDRTIFEILEIDNISKITKGHSGNRLYRGRLYGKNIVIKLSNNNKKLKTKNEVVSNIDAYHKIRESGGEYILPTILQHGKILDNDYIILNNYGDDLYLKLKKMNYAEADKILKYFFCELKILIKKSTKTDSKIEEQEYGLQELKDSLISWINNITKVKEHDLLKKLLEKTEKIDIPKLCSDKSSLMLLDLTPDNIFIFKNKIIYIDPWAQTTYRGSLVPCIGQFITLLRNIYQIKYTDSYDFNSPFFKHISDILNLDSDKLRAQFYLGSCLQLILSAYSRRDSESFVDLLNKANQQLDLIATIH